MHARSLHSLLLSLMLLGVSPAHADSAKAARFYEDALARYEKKDDAGAIIQLKNALQEDPAYLSAHLLLGQAQLRKGDLGGAELSFNTALKMGADRSEVFGLLADAYLAQNKYRLLLDTVQPTGLPPEAAMRLWLTRAYAHLALADYVGAEQALDRAAALSPQSGLLAVARGMYHLQRGDLAAARPFADQAVKLLPGEPRGWNLKASIAHAAGQHAAALEAYGRALTLEPGFVDVRVARAGLLLDQNRFDEAFKDLQYLKQKHPEEPRAAYLRALYAARKGDAKTANAELMQAARVISAIPPERLNGNAQLLMLGALANFGIKAHEQAQAYAAGYIRLRPAHPGARKLLGAILLARGLREDAVRHLEAARRASPQDPELINLLASAYLAGNQHAKAANLLEAAGPAVLDSSDLTRSLGYSLIGLGQADQGLDHLTRAYAKNPADTRLGSSLVMLNLRHQRPAEAVRVAKAYLDKHPKDPGGLNLLGVAKAGAGDLEGAHKAYTQALAAAPAFHPARLNLAKLEAARGRHDAARAQFQAILKAQPKHPQAMFELAGVELAAGRPAEALRWYNAAHAQEPRNILFSLKLVDVYLLLGQADKALEQAKQLGAADGDNFQVMSALGRAHAAAGQTERAAASFAKMSKLAGFKTPLLEETARLQLRLGDLDGASLSLTKALGEQPAAVGANALMAELSLRKGQRAEALERAKRLAANAPRSALAQRALAEISQALGQHAQAATAYQAALRLEDRVDDALGYHQALLGAGQSAQALSFIESWSRAHPREGRALIALGETQLRAGQLDPAKRTYQAYLKQIGEHPAVLNNLATIQMRQADKQALATAERAYALAPNAAPVNDTLGWLLLQAGQVDRALRHLREARLRAPGNAEIHFHLASALHRAGRKGEALKELDLALGGGARFDQRAEAERLRTQLRGQ